MRILVIALLLGSAFAAQVSAQTPPPPEAPTTASTPSTPPADAPIARPPLATANDVDHWRVITSPYTYHYSQDPAHRPVRMIGFERQHQDGGLWGAAYFSNSFGQPSGYAYLGQQLTNFSDYNKLFAQWTAGVIYGYKGQYKDKVPLNHDGFSPGLVLSVGWQFTPRYSTQLNVLGTSALMFQFSAELP